MSEPIWETSKEIDDYEICVQYPYQIRKKSNKRILKEYVNNKGYLINILYINIIYVLVSIENYTENIELLRFNG